MSKHHLQHCTEDRRKVRFRDKKQAIDKLHIMQNAGKRQLEQHGHTKRNEKRVYECSACKGWHTTSHDRWDARDYTLAS